MVGLVDWLRRELCWGGFLSFDDQELTHIGNEEQQCAFDVNTDDTALYLSEWKVFNLQQISPFCTVLLKSTTCFTFLSSFLKIFNMTHLSVKFFFSWFSSAVTLACQACCWMTVDCCWLTASCCWMTTACCCSIATSSWIVVWSDHLLCAVSIGLVRRESDSASVHQRECFSWLSRSRSRDDDRNCRVQTEWHFVWEFDLSAV